MNSTVPAVFGQHDRSVLGFIVRRVAYDLVRVFVLLPGPGLRGDLRRAGLARNVESFDASLRARAAFVDNAPHRARYRSLNFWTHRRGELPLVRVMNLRPLVPESVNASRAL